MKLEPLPQELQNIEDDGRTNQEIIDGFEARGIAVFDKQIFGAEKSQAPSEGAAYRFLAVLSDELPKTAKLSADQVFAAVGERHAGVKRAPLRAALLLQERMTRERLYADTVVMNEPVVTEDGKLGLVILSREDDEGTSWIGIVDEEFISTHNVLLVFLDNADKTPDREVGGVF
jgi:hypothetical protein